MPSKLLAAAATPLLLVCGSLGSAATPEDLEATVAAQAESTRAMAQRLDSRIRASDPLRSILSDRPEDRLAALRAALLGAKDFSSQLQARNRLAHELMRAGKNAEAIRGFKALVRDVQGRVTPASEARVRRALATAHLRVAEAENCQHAGNARACLLPIRGTGIHQRQAGAREAALELLEVLRLDPNDVGAQWLLNLAHMNLGDPPSEVPEAWRMGLEIFGAADFGPAFENVAPDLGVSVLGLSGGVVLEDLNGDAALDIMVSSWGLRDPLRVFINGGDGRFVETTADAGLEGITGGLNLIHADYDNDGDVDVLVLRGAWLGAEGTYPNSLLRNRGNGVFDDVTEEAGVLSFYPTQTAAWGDYDNDGDLDLFVGNESLAGQESPCELFRNNGDGTFEEVAQAVGLDHVGFVKAVVWGDYDNDGRIDLYISRLAQPNVLLRNLGPGTQGWRFDDVTAAAGVAEPVYSFPSWFWDYDNDGWLDLMVLPFPDFTAESLSQVVQGYIGEGVPEGFKPRLYRNLGDGTFEDRSQTLGVADNMLAMGANYGDLDNDGRLDFYVGTGEPDLSTLVPNRMYRSDADGGFSKVTISGGFGHLQKGHGIAWGDIDLDGDQDIYAVMGGAYPSDVAFDAIYENPGSENRWLTLSLEGVEANRSAIGSRITVVVSTPEGQRSIRATVGTGGSFGSSSLRQELGLGRASAVERVEIRWAGSGYEQTIEGLDLDSSYRIREGRPAEPLAGTSASWHEASGQPAN